MMIIYYVSKRDGTKIVQDATLQTCLKYKGVESLTPEFKEEETPNFYTGWIYVGY